MEKMLKFVVKYVLDNCKDEMKFFDGFVEKGLIEKLEKLELYELGIEEEEMELIEQSISEKSGI